MARHELAHVETRDIPVLNDPAAADHDPVGAMGAAQHQRGERIAAAGDGTVLLPAVSAQTAAFAPPCSAARALSRVCTSSTPEPNLSRSARRGTRSASRAESHTTRVPLTPSGWFSDGSRTNIPVRTGWAARFGAGVGASGAGRGERSSVARPTRLVTTRQAASSVTPIAAMVLSPRQASRSDDEFWVCPMAEAALDS